MAGGPWGWIMALAARAVAPALPPESPDGGGDDDARPTWDGGWWLGAQHRQAHRGRIGGAIRPWLVVVHTTDVGPSDRTWAGMMDRLEHQAGEGNGAHFWIGRDTGQGVIQWDSGIAVATNLCLVAKRLFDCLAKNDCGVFDCVVNIDVSVTSCLDPEVDQRVLRERGKQVVEERHSGRNL